MGDALLVARGTVIGQAPFVLLTPVITRLFSTRELGIYGLALAFVGIAGPVAGLRLELAAISARDDGEARALLILSALAMLPVTLLSVIILCVLKARGVGAYGALSWWVVALTGATIAAAGLYASMRSWLVRRGRIQLVANSLAVQGCLRAGIPVAFVWLSAGAGLLIGAELIARASVVALMARGGGLWAALKRTPVRLRSLREPLMRYWKYPVLMGPSALIDAAATALPVPILASHYGLGAAGKFALVQRLVMLPAALVVGSVGDVFHAHAADVVGGSGGVAVTKFLTGTAARLLLLGIVVYVPVAVIAPFAASWVFGPTWADAGILIALLAPLCIAQTTVTPISRGLLLSGREERKLLADIVCLVLPVTTLYLARNQPMTIAVAYFSAAATVAYIVYYAVIVTALRGGPAAPGTAS
jgi:O-antigen/teichoic acid export membrane protein